MRMRHFFKSSSKKLATYMFKTECGIRENLDTNEYPNIFESKNLHKQISEYICFKKFDTNECPNKYLS